MTTLLEEVRTGWIFSDESIQKILAGWKDTTRRIVTRHNSEVGTTLQWDRLDWTRTHVDPGGTPIFGPGPYLKVGGPDDTMHRVYSRVSKGDAVYVREAFCKAHFGRSVLVGYRATDADRYGGDLGEGTRWTSPLFMAKEYARIVLRVVELDVHRIDSITDEQARHEGFCTREEFVGGWDRLNAHRADFASNPWVWAYRFEVIEADYWAKRAGRGAA